MVHIPLCPPNTKGTGRRKQTEVGGRGIINLTNTGPKKGAQVETCFWPDLEAQNAKQRVLQ